MNKSSLILLAFITGCASLPDNTPTHYLQTENITPPTQETFPHCYNYGCKNVVYTVLSDEEWRNIDALFTPPIKNAQDERSRISQSIALFETYVGARTGTEVDGYGTFRNMGNFHHDCVDESTNTTVYLMMLRDRGLIKHHTLSAPDTRFPLINGGRWPHKTAVIRDTQTHERYAVDSWFHDNGFPAEVISMNSWKKGWKPEENFERGSDSNPHK
ncbi:MAG: hypothetical protein ACTHOO_08295 [Alcanivorax sp.]